MAKQQRKAQLTKTDNHQGQTIEETFDDNLLPDASEIEKLKELDPNIVDWLKARAEKEQDFRHNAYNERLKIVSKSEFGIRTVNYLGIIFSFFILLAGMFVSYNLIVNDYQIVGSIFTGIMLISVIAIFMSKVKSNNNEKTPNP